MLKLSYPTTLTRFYLFPPSPEKKASVPSGFQKGPSMTNHARRQQGFTLIEAAVAIAVVAILSGIIVPLVVKNLQDSQIARAKNDIQVIAAAVASQIKDTGTRPSILATTAPTMTGAGDVSWGSGGNAVTNVTAPGANNTFANLFASGTAAGAQNEIFGTTNAAEFSYKGPYLATDVALKSDPWGGKYYVLGYNATGKANNGPIWILCGGPNGSIDSANVPAAGVVEKSTWATTLTSVDDIVVRVN